MKKFFALLLALVMALSLVACGEKKDEPKTDGDDATYPEYFAGMDELITAAKAEGELVVYGSCEEEYLAAACQHFEELFGIKTTFQRLSTGEVQAKIEEENGNPSADVWFGGTTDPYNVCAAEGLLEPYAAVNASHLIGDMYKDADNNWFGIYKGILGFMVNTDELARKEQEAPADWADLLKDEYKGEIWLSNYNTAGTAKLVVNTMIQKYGHDEGIKYLVDLDKNIEVYTKSGSGPSKNVGTGECIIGIGFLHDGITQIVDNGYTNVSLIIPSSGTSFEVGATAIFKGAAHSNAAKLVINTMIQKYGHDEGIQYLVDLDKNIEVYTKSGSGPSKNVGTGECVIGIGFLHDGITQIVDNGYDNIELIIPSSGTSCEIGATAIFKGAKHPNAAKLWVEYALSPECVELAAKNGSYQFLVIDNAEQPSQASEFGLDPNNVMEYDFEDAKANTTTYVEEVMKALADSGANTEDTGRFQTE